MWDLPGPGLEPVSPALAGGFLTIAPPEKPPEWYLFYPSVFPVLSRANTLLPRERSPAWVGADPECV